MREAFDRTFALPRPEPGEAPETLLCVRVAGEPFVVRTAEIAGIAAGLRTTPLPGRAPGLLGLAVQRGTPMAVYDLAALLGMERRGPAPRWVALCDAGERVALAFDELEGHLRASAADVCDDSGSDMRPSAAAPTSGHGSTGSPRAGPPLPRVTSGARRVLRAGGRTHAVLDLPHLTSEIRRRAGARAPAGES